MQAAMKEVCDARRIDSFIYLLSWGSKRVESTGSVSLACAGVCAVSLCRGMRANDSLELFCLF